MLTRDKKIKITRMQGVYFIIFPGSPTQPNFTKFDTRGVIADVNE